MIWIVHIYYIHFFFVIIDYVWAGSHTLKFISSKTWENIVISIVNDTVIEGTESLIISLTDPQPPDAIHTAGTTTIIITNDDFREYEYLKL